MLFGGTSQEWAPPLTKSELERIRKAEQKEMELERLREEEERRRRQLEEEREREEQRRAEHEKRFLGKKTAEDGGVIGLSLREQTYYQEKTGFVHNGLITIGELTSYEDQIHNRAKKNKAAMASFRQRVTQMMMVDPDFAEVMTAYSKEYKALADKAAEEEKKLEWKANISGFSKAMHCVGTVERQKARDDLERLKRSREAHWRRKFDTEENRTAWITAMGAVEPARITEEGTGRVVELGIEESIKRNIAEMDAAAPIERMTNELEQMAREAAGQTDRRQNEQQDDRGQTEVRYDSSDPVAARMVAQGGKIINLTGDDEGDISLSDVAALDYASDRFSWETVLEDTELALKACGKLGSNMQEQKAAFVKITGRLRTWAEDRKEDEVVEHLIRHAASDQPALFYTENLRRKGFYYGYKNRDAVLDSEKQCERLLKLMGVLGGSSVYDRLTKEQRQAFDEAALWISGLHAWYHAMAEQVRAWHRYYNTPADKRADIPAKDLPKPVGPAASYFR